MLNRISFSRHCLVPALALTLASCSAPDHTPTPVEGVQDPVIATYAGGEVRRSDIAASLASRLARFGATPDAETRRATVRELVARQVRIDVLHQQAIASGLEQRPDVATRIAARKDMSLAQAWLEREVLAQANVSEQTIDAELARRLPAATRPERRAFSHIFLRATNANDVARARQTAADIRRRLDAGESFAALAREYSDSITARAGGTVHLTPRSALSDDLGKLIFGMAEGSVSEPVVNHDGLHLFRVDAVVAETPADATALRKSIASELRSEARGAAENSARQLALDETGVDVANIVHLLSKGCEHPGDSLFAVSGQTLTCSGFEVLRKRWPLFQPLTPDAALTWLISNRVLAQRMLEKPGAADGEIRNLIEQAVRNELVAARRDELLDSVDTSVSDDEIAARRQELGISTPELHEFVADLLFIVQSGSATDAVYSEGERIAAQLRKGTDFSQLLESAEGRPGTRVLRNQGGLLLAELSRDQPPLRDELLRLAAGEVSIPMYISGNPIRANGRVLIADQGLLFARKKEERLLALSAAREFLVKSISEQKRADEQAAIKSELDRQAAMQMLLVDG